MKTLGCRPWRLVLLLLAALLFPRAGWAASGEVRSPHSAEACIECHLGKHRRADGEGVVPRIIVPQGNDDHRVLLETCSSCHPEGMRPFWILVFPGGGPAPAAGAVQPSARPAFENPHDAMECGGCHRNQVAFGMSSDAARELVEWTGDISDFCRRCHDDVVGRHFPRGNIPLGRTTCATCHRPHGATALPTGLRDDYYRFVRHTTEVNPHGGDPFCLACHATRPLPGEPPDFIPGSGGTGRLCGRCHPGESHHVLGVGVSEKTWKMEYVSFPLDEGKVDCVTCHEPHGGIGEKEGGSGYSLRGEPYTRIVDFCVSCHEDEGWESLNPHDQITVAGEVVGLSCLFCHVSVPDLTARDYVLEDDFNDSFTGVCTKCHEALPHPDVDHLLKPSAEAEADMKSYEQRREVVLPLDFDGRVTCVTCHNPHEKGLLTGPDAVGADELKRLRLTTFNEICTPCHGRH